MIIDYTYFKGVLDIGLNPGVCAPSVTSEAERGRIESFISTYEREYLMRMLGMGMYMDLVKFCECPSGSPMRRVVDMLKQDHSPIACYVYFRYAGMGGLRITQTGAVTSSSGEDGVSPEPLQIRAWNDMVTQNIMILQEMRRMGLNPETDPFMLETINPLGV